MTTILPWTWRPACIVKASRIRSTGKTAAIGPQAVIAANPELREREALKGFGLTASMAGALSRRGVPDLTARVAVELGALAWEIAYERWIDTANGDDFSELARRALGELQAATALC